MTITGIIVAIIIGAIIGALGRLVLPGRQPIGILLTIGVGIVAALLGTAIAQQVGVATTNGIDWIELVFQIGLAAVGVAAVAAFQRRSHSGSRH
ncbi:GlsB/YeaQ/YmgE family stress response membrane protein [Spirillospora sp. NPDC127200]